MIIGTIRIDAYLLGGKWWYYPIIELNYKISENMAVFRKPLLTYDEDNGQFVLTDYNCAVGFIDEETAITEAKEAIEEFCIIRGLVYNEENFAIFKYDMF
ncbi:MAG: hypothetical protein EKK63_15770 [Acinetobacter sp.]|uniref:hypothetical protein n=1 Tax=Acinetobacter sp. TaxID=472 RepID=UPI000F9DE13A|nr:hypothetical protein [Acinetobacter sp.]RUP37027.1 MAG: hypothetical protein EKK63_15770 [Acinetobacter sp.]